MNNHDPATNQTDQAIDRVLAALATAEPDPGMDRRVLARLQSAQNASHSPRHWNPAWLSPAVALPLVAIALLTLVWTHRPHSNPGTQPPVVFTQQALAPETHFTSAIAPMRRRPAPRPRALPEPFQPANAAQQPSFPAPPMPLTPQERLLLQLARNGVPAAPPTLDLENLAALEGQQEAQFQNRAQQPPTETPPTQLDAGQLLLARTVDLDDLATTPKPNGVQP